MKKIVLAALALLVAGCATEYGEMGFTGGVRADQISANQYRIVSRGNGYSDASSIADYAIRKAAEVTLESGNEWFLVMGRDDQSGVSLSATTTPTQTTGTINTWGNTATYNATTYGGRVNIQTIVKPGEDLLILVGSGPQPDAAYNAAETLRYVAPRTSQANPAGTVARRVLLGF